MFQRNEVCQNALNEAHRIVPVILMRFPSFRLSYLGKFINQRFGIAFAIWFITRRLRSC